MRLEKALANRQKAKAAAEEAQKSVESAETALFAAQEEATKALGAEEKDEDGAATRPMPQSVVSSDEQYDLETVAKKARKAGNPISQVGDLVQAAMDEEIGTFIKGALDRIMKASDETLRALNAATSLADDLDAATKTATGGDAAGEMHRLEDSLKKLRKAFEEARGCATRAEEAAAKCQVEKTQEMTDETRRRADGVTTQARAVGNNARSIAKAAERQVEALESAKNMVPRATVATEKALASFSSFRAILSDASAAELKAKAESDAAARAKADATRKAREEEERKKIQQNLNDGDESPDIRSSPAPPRGSRGNMMRAMTKHSVKDLLDAPGAPDSPVSTRQQEGGLRNSSAPPQMISTSMAQRTFKDLFDEAMEGGVVEGHLMKQSKFFSRWRPRYFRLEDGFLTYYDKKSLVGTHKNKHMELTAHSITSFTNTKNCFCVRTGDPPLGSSVRSVGGTPREEEVWFLLGKDEVSMNRWMTAINAQIHGLFIKLYNVPDDNYWSQGQKGRFFYRMVEDALPQWIRTYPEEAAPRTGDGLFPAEVIEVTQVLSNKDKVYLRIANDRGWTYANNVPDNAILFEEIKGDVATDV